MKQVHIYRERKQSYYLLMAGAFVFALGAWLLIDGKDQPWIGIIAVLMGVGFIALGIRNLRSKMPLIIIRKEGIWAENLAQGAVMWNQVVSAYMLPYYKQRFLALEIDTTYHVAPPAWFLKELAKVVGSRDRCVLIDATETDVDGGVLVAFITQMLKADDATRMQLMEQFAIRTKNKMYAKV